MAGNWDSALDTIGTMRLPETTLRMIYEHVVLELVESQEFALARRVLRDTAPMQSTKLVDPEQYKRLARMAATQMEVNQRDLFGDETRERKRQTIADAICNVVDEVPAGRLVAVVEDAVRYLQSCGEVTAPGEVDLMRTYCRIDLEKEDVPVSALACALKFGAAAHPESVAFAPDGGELVAIGAADGVVEIWDWKNGKLKDDLPYQKEGNYMAHSTAVLALSFGRHGKLLASGSQDGQLKIWDVETGKCERNFANAHSHGICGIEFSRDGRQLLTASFDKSARLHDIRNGKTIRAFTDHNSFVTGASFLGDSATIATSSVDGKLRIWNVSDPQQPEVTTSCPGEGPEGEIPPLNALLVRSGQASQSWLVVLCPKGSTLYFANSKGQILRAIRSPGEEFIALAASAAARLVYAARDNGIIECFNAADGKHQRTLDTGHGSDFVGFVHHPHLNVLASWDANGNVKIFAA
eukprot:Polyplicarium_translucidae@DN3036_c0_g1_i1.p1